MKSCHDVKSCHAVITTLNEELSWCSSYTKWWAIMAVLLTVFIELAWDCCDNDVIEILRQELCLWIPPQLFYGKVYPWETLKYKMFTVMVGWLVGFLALCLSSHPQFSIYLVGGVDGQCEGWGGLDNCRPFTPAIGHTHSFSPLSGLESLH